MFMGNCKQRALVAASLLNIASRVITRAASGVYIIHGIAVILPPPRLRGGHVQLRQDEFPKPGTQFPF